MSRRICDFGWPSGADPVNRATAGAYGAQGAHTMWHRPALADVSDSLARPDVEAPIEDFAMRRTQRSHCSGARRSRPGWRTPLLCLTFTFTALAPWTSPASQADTGFRPTWGRPFTADSVWNSPIVRNPVLDSRTREQVAYFGGAGHPGIADLYDYGVPVWDAIASTPRYSVTCEMDWGTCGLERQRVPIPARAFPSRGTDGAMVVIDWPNGVVYEFWKARKTSSTTWSAGWGGVVRFDGKGTPGAATGAGVSRLAGVVRTFEMARGRVDHALVFSTNNACKVTYRYPASKTDGRSSRTDCIPLGARIQLDPSIDVNSIPGMSAAEKIIAKALQRYGAYAIDNGGAPMAFVFETPGGEADPYCSVGLCSDYKQMDGIPWKRLRVLRRWSGLGPQ